MRAPDHTRAALRRFAAILVMACSLCFAGAAVADDRAVQFQYSEPTFGVKVFELFQRGPRLMLEERTTRAFAPHHVRNIKLGEVWPAEGDDPITVHKSRDHIDFFGSYWREDGTNDYGKYEVEIWEVGEGEHSGVSEVRVRIVERSDISRSPKRRMKHPEHDAAQRAKRGH